MSGTCFCRSDLALEFAKGLLQEPPEGLSLQKHRHGNIEIVCINIDSPKLSHQLKKPCGRYITIETPPLWNSLLDPQEEINACADCIRHLLPATGNILVAGLGNRSITPDALGPEVIDRIFATRHIPQETAKKIGLDKLRQTSAIAPGVMGQTGIESGEIILSLIKSIRPAAVIAVDALAAEDYTRLGKTIQISDSGISPGSGVQNNRFPLNRDTLGIPVISIGVPTVIHAASFLENQNQNHPAFGAVVTPREVDRMIGHSAKFISLAVNKALYPDLSLEEIAFLCT